MSDSRPAQPTTTTRRDAGMTLPELLVTMVVLGIVVTVIATAIIVTLRTERVSAGRVDLARAEQSVGLWLPGDLASADTVTTDPWATPCGAPVCDGIDLSEGSNVLMLTWDVGGARTQVSYNFRPSSGGGYELVRVTCVNSSSCSALVLLTDLPGPPSGPFVPGVGTGEAACRARDEEGSSEPPCSRPTWIIQVSAPLVYDAASGGDVEATGDQIKDANRVLVTVYDDSGATNEGFSQISITAGGTTRRTISATSLLGAPTLTAVRSRCGGPITLVVDVSLSIGAGNVTNVRNAVTAFVNALIGTPVQIQVVEFHTRTRVLGTDGWRKYFDMTKEEEVSALQSAIQTIAMPSNSNGNGYTNWEEALFRTFYDPEVGSEPPAVTSQLPETVVFFTDGIPTRDRTQAKTPPANGDPLPPLPELGGAGGYGTYGSEFNQVSFNRAEYIARRFRNDVRLVGVGVGSFGSSNTSAWVTQPGAPLFDTPQRRQTWTYERRLDYFQDTYQSRQNFVFQHQYQYRARYFVRDGSGAPWRAVNQSTYQGWSPTSDRQDRGSSASNWLDTNRATYQQYADNSHSDSTSGRSDGFIRLNAWTQVDAAEYGNFNTGPTESDGYRKWPAGSPGNWVPISQAEYNANNISSYTGGSAENDGYRTQSTSITTAVYLANIGVAGFRAEPRANWTSNDINAAQFTALDTVAGQGDNYRKSPSGGNNWVPVSQAEYDFYSNSSYNQERNGYRIESVTGGTGDPDGYASPTTISRRNSSILTHFITGVPPNPTTGLPGVDATTPGPGGQYDLVEVQEASMFFPTDWTTEFPKAMQAIALGECGGTLTLQTRVANDGGQPARDPVEYVNAWTKFKDQPQTVGSSTVWTNLSATASTFDFLIPSGQYVDVGVLVNNFGELSEHYEHDRWECRAGPNSLTGPPDFAYPTEPWPEDRADEWPDDWRGFAVRVAANEAVSCTQWVNLKSGGT